MTNFIQHPTRTNWFATTRTVPTTIVINSSLWTIHFIWGTIIYFKRTSSFSSASNSTQLTSCWAFFIQQDIIIHLSRILVASNMKGCRRICTIIQHMFSSEESVTLSIWSFTTIAYPQITMIFYSYRFHNGLPTSGGCDTMFVLVDRHTKLVHFIPCKKMIIGEETIRLYLKYVYRYHGLHVDIKSDGGSQFVSKFWRALFGAPKVVIKLSDISFPNWWPKRVSQKNIVAIFVVYPQLLLETLDIVYVTCWFYIQQLYSCVNSINVILWQ